MVNLLSEKLRSALSNTYYARLGTFLFVGCAFATLAGAAFLLPSYLLAKGDAEASARYVDAAQQSVKLGAKGGAPGVFAQLSERISILKSYPRSPAIATVLAAVTGVPSGITLQKISITPSEEGKGAVALSGIAQSRVELVAYVQSLQTKRELSGVAVPLAELAGETNVPFTLTFSYQIP